MRFKPNIWHPISAVLSVANVAGVGLAAQAAEPIHAAVHAALAVAFGLWSLRLRQRSTGGDDRVRLETLELEMGALRDELSETQERLDFAERMLAQERSRAELGPHR